MNTYVYVNKPKKKGKKRSAPESWTDDSQIKIYSKEHTMEDMALNMNKIIVGVCYYM